MLLASSPAQTQFIKQAVLHNLRIDGRTNWAKRTPLITTDVLPHLPGSSYAYLQHENIEIYTGIKLKMNKVKSVSQEPKKIELEINSMRKLADDDNDQLARLQTLLQIHFVDRLAHQEALRKYLTIPGAKKHELTMYIDVFLLSTPHVEQLELIQAGIMAALNSTVTSQISVAYNEVTDEETTEITSAVSHLLIDRWEQLVVVGIVDQREFVTDLRKQEYEAMDTCFLITISDGKAIHVQSLKGSSSPDTINKAVRFALTVEEKNRVQKPSKQ